MPMISTIPLAGSSNRQTIQEESDNIVVYPLALFEDNPQIIGLQTADLLAMPKEEPKQGMGQHRIFISHSNNDSAVRKWILNLKQSSSVWMNQIDKHDDHPTVVDSYNLCNKISSDSYPGSVVFYDYSIPVSQETRSTIRWPAQTRLQTVHPSILLFSRGFEGVVPESGIVDTAHRITAAALRKTVEPEITVDVDGALSFDLRLSNGLLILAELDLYGNLDASVYDDKKGELISRMPYTNVSKLTGWF